LSDDKEEKREKVEEPKDENNDKMERIYKAARRPSKEEK
jgi:hypothetical protein